MKRLEAMLLMIVLATGIISLAAAAGTANAAKGTKPGAVAVEVIKWSGTVKAVDYEKRTVTLAGEGGKTFTLNAKNARNLDQVKAGDKVKVEYVQELAVFVEKAGGPAGAKALQTVALAPKGQMPGGVVANTVEIQANVEGINYKKRTITLKGPEGNIQTYKVGKEVKHFKQVKEGDQVVLRVTEAIALEVEKK
jgi:Cu/Ag efflux protein CusF